MGTRRGTKKVGEMVWVRIDLDELKRVLNHLEPHPAKGIVIKCPVAK